MILKVQKIQQNIGRQKDKLEPGVSHLISTNFHQSSKMFIFYFHLNLTS